MKTLDALIFDVDGTLAETEDLHRRAFNASFAQAGLEWQWDRALYAQLLNVTGGKERIRFYIDRMPNPPVMSAADIAALHAAKTARYTAMLRQGIALRPGIARLMHQAHAAGIRLAIATTTSRPNVDALLCAAGTLPPLHTIAAGDEVPAKKPAPDIYRLALKRLDLAPAHCIAFEDTVNGLRSANGAGLACVVTKSVYGGDGPFPEACAVVDDLAGADLPAVARWHAAACLSHDTATSGG
jgi:HAD superfamily hydrolase (TIGR01509 family)